MISKTNIQKWSVGVMLVACAFLAYSATASADTSASGTVSVGVSASTSRPDHASSSADIKAGIRAKIENRVDARVQSIKANVLQNRDTRNARLEVRTDAKKEIRDIRASSSEALKEHKGDAAAKKEILTQRKEDIMKVRGNETYKELTISLNNLKNIATRIQSRIDKIKAAGKDVTAATALLATANSKISQAQINVAAFASVAERTGTSTVSASSTVSTPTKAAFQTARKSIQDAREALRKALGSIIEGHFNIEIKASSTIATSTTTSTATSTN